MAQTTTTEILRELASKTKGSITLGELLARLGDRSFGLAILVLTLPNTIPLVPGFASLCAVPMAIIAAQLLMGSPYIRLPRYFAETSLSRATLSRLLLRCLPLLIRMEKHIRPRLPAFTSPQAEKAISLLWIVLAAIIFLPIPFGDPIPSAAAALMALGMLEKDGTLIAFGIIVSLATIIGMAMLVQAATLMLWHLAAQLF